MLEYEKKTLLEKYQDYSLRVDPFILNAAGYNPQETLVKINNHIIFCTPVFLSLTNCKVILSLSSEEYEYFIQYIDQLISISFAFNGAYFGKDVTFYIRGSFDKLVKLRESVYILHFTPRSISEAFKEIFLYMSDMLESYKDIYRDDPVIEQNKCITPKTFNKLTLAIGNKMLCNGSVNSISSTKVQFKVENNLQSIEKDKSYDIYTNFYTKRIKLKGKLVENSDGECKVNLDYKTEFIYILSKFIENSNGNDEELDDL